jgi:hypothetical protein
VQSWVSADRAELDDSVHDTVANWLASDWPFTSARYRTTSDVSPTVESDATSGPAPKPSAGPGAS